MLQSARNIIIGTNNKFIEAHEAMIAEGARLGILGPGRSISGALNPRDPNHKIAIIRNQEADILLKQLLESILSFGALVTKFKLGYNNFKKNHEQKALRKLIIDWDSEEDFKQTFYISV